jgi:hypothetical protein
MPNVTVRPPSTINVRIGNQNPAHVQSINYGSRTLKSASDLYIDGANTGDVIAYNSETKTFVVEPASVALGDIDGGIF